MTKILITGGAGLIGKALAMKLKERGYAVAILSRSSQQITGISSHNIDIENNSIDIQAVVSADCIIHLAGANIGESKWTANRKKRIVDSRIKTANLIFETIAKNNNNLKVFISASAIGYYGAITTEKIFDETHPAHTDFIGETCKQWEEAADNFAGIGIRTVIIRTGVVLSGAGGALSKMLLPFRLGMGIIMGSGKQYMPWIHIDDLCCIYMKAVEDQDMKGAYNAVAPDHQTNKSFAETIMQVLKKPKWLINIPSFFLRLMLGQMSQIILEGSRVSSEKIIKAGFRFKYHKLEHALEDVLNKQRK